MFILLSWISLASAAAGPAPVDWNFERYECVRARIEVADAIIQGLRVAKTDPEAAVEKLPAVVNAMFSLNQRLNARPTHRERRIFSDCVNSGLIDDLRSEIATMTPGERAHARLYADKLRRQGLFKTRTLAGRRASRKRFWHDASELGATLMMLPATVLGLAAVATETDSIELQVALLAGAVVTGLTSSLWAGANDWDSVIHRDAIGFAPRACADILAGVSHFEMPAVTAPPRLLIEPR